MQNRTEFAIEIDIKVKALSGIDPFYNLVWRNDKRQEQCDF